MIIPRGLLILAFAGLAIPIGRGAPPDFSQIAGRYEGTYELVGSSTFRANVTITITVPASGRKASIQIGGFGSDPTAPQATVGNHTLTAARRISSDSFLLAYILQFPAMPARFSGTRQDFRFTLRGTTVANSAVNYIISLRGRRLSMLGSGSVSGTPVGVRLVATRQGR